MFGVFFFVSLYVQQILGYSPIQAGASFLPWTLLIVVLAPQAGRLTDRVGPRWLVTGGMIVLAASLFMFSRMGANETFWDLLPADDPRRRRHVGNHGSGHLDGDGIRCPRDKAGVGSAVLNSMRQVGGSLGIAIMGAIVAQSVTTEGPTPAPEGVPHGVPSRARDRRRSSRSPARRSQRSRSGRCSTPPSRHRRRAASRLHESPTEGWPNDSSLDGAQSERRRRLCRRRERV